MVKGRILGYCPDCGSRAVSSQATEWADHSPDFTYITCPKCGWWDEYANSPSDDLDDF